MEIPISEDMQPIEPQMDGAHGSSRIELIMEGGSQVLTFLGYGTFFADLW